MKKLVTLFIAGLITITTKAQSELPQAIQDINKDVKEINEGLGKPINETGLSGDVLFSHDVWIKNNNISKVVATKGNSKTEYYFKYDRLIFIKNTLTYIVFKEETFVKNDSVVEREGYFNYDELISQDYLLYEGEDTLFWGVTVQKEGYRLWKKYHHRLNFNPYSAMLYDSIVAYDFRGEGGGSIVYKDKLDKTAKNNIKLSQQQTDSLLFFVCDTGTYGNGTSACFDPHMGIVFYKQGKIISTIDVCFGCNYLISSTYLPAQSYHSRVNTYDDYLIHQSYHGFSEEGKRRLKWLCVNLGLEYCPDRKGYEGLFEKIPAQGE